MLKSTSLLAALFLVPFSLGKSLECSASETALECRLLEQPAKDTKMTAYFEAMGGLKFTQCSLDFDQSNWDKVQSVDLIPIPQVEVAGMPKLPDRDQNIKVALSNGIEYVEEHVITAKRDARYIKTCRVVGDPHIHTFSGRQIDFMGIGEFVLVESENLRIIGSYTSCGWSVSCATGVSIQYKDAIYVLRASGSMATIETVGKSSTAGTFYEQVGSAYRITLEDGSVINVSGGSILGIEIHLTSVHKGQVDGHCHVFEDNQNAPFTCKGTEYNNFNEWASCWKVEESKNCFRGNCAPLESNSKVHDVVPQVCQIPETPVEISPVPVQAPPKQMDDLPKQEVPVQGDLPVQSDLPVQGNLPVQEDLPKKTDLPVKDDLPKKSEEALAPLETVLPIQDDLPKKTEEALAPLETVLPIQDDLPKESDKAAAIETYEAAPTAAPTPKQLEEEVAPAHAAPKQQEEEVAPVQAPPKQQEEELAPVNAPHKQQEEEVAPVQAPPKQQEEEVAPVQAPPKQQEEELAPVNAPPKQQEEEVAPVQAPPKQQEEEVAPVQAPPKQQEEEVAPVQAPPKQQEEEVAPVQAPPKQQEEEVAPVQAPPKQQEEEVAPVQALPKQQEEIVETIAPTTEALPTQAAPAQQQEEPIKKEAIAEELPKIHQEPAMCPISEDEATSWCNKVIEDASGCSKVANREIYVSSCAKDVLKSCTYAFCDSHKTAYQLECATKTDMMKLSVHAEVVLVAHQIRVEAGFGKENSCPNSCSGSNGVCDDGIGCICKPGFSGLDCSVSLVEAPAYDIGIDMDKEDSPLSSPLTQNLIKAPLAPKAPASAKATQPAMAPVGSSDASLPVPQVKVDKPSTAGVSQVNSPSTSGGNIDLGAIGNIGKFGHSGAGHLTASLLSLAMIIAFI